MSRRFPPHGDWAFPILEQRIRTTYAVQFVRSAVCTKYGVPYETGGLGQDVFSHGEVVLGDEAMTYVGFLVMITLLCSVHVLRTPDANEIVLRHFHPHFSHEEERKSERGCLRNQ